MLDTFRFRQHLEKHTSDSGWESSVRVVKLPAAPESRSAFCSRRSSTDGSIRGYCFSCHSIMEV